MSLWRLCAGLLALLVFAQQSVLAEGTESGAHSSAAADSGTEVLGVKPPVPAVIATEELLERLDSVTALAGNFEQRQFTADGSLQSVSSGSYALLRPGYFRWDIQSPDSQLIVADPRYLWHYDRDLETASRRTLTDAGDLAPLQLLGGQDEVLRRRFTVEHHRQTPQNFDVGYRLLPIDANTSFDAIDVFFSAGQLRGMDVTDRSGQRIRIELTPAEKAVELAPDDFEFLPPDGVDIFYDEQ